MYIPLSHFSLSLSLSLSLSPLSLSLSLLSLSLFSLSLSSLSLSLSSLSLSLTLSLSYSLSLCSFSSFLLSSFFLSILPISFLPPSSSSVPSHTLSFSNLPLSLLSLPISPGFVPCIDQLFDENLLVGSGWTTKETVRSLAYSILADLVHHIRTSLSLPQLSQAVHVFSKNVHDESFPVSIQTMSCKVRWVCGQYWRGQLKVEGVVVDSVVMCVHVHVYLHLLFCMH